MLPSNVIYLHRVNCGTLMEYFPRNFCSIKKDMSADKKTTSICPNLNMYDSCIRSFLGPNKSNKLLDDCGQIEIINCAARYLHQINPENPIHQLIDSCVHSFHKRFGCGSATYLSMFYFWHRAFQKLQIENWNIRHIIKELEACLEFAIFSIESITIYIHSEGLHAIQPQNPDKAACHTKDLVSSSDSWKSISTFMRGLSRNDCLFASTIETLWHNQNSEITKEGLLDLRFDISLITSSTSGSPTSNIRVLSGLVVPVSHEAAELIAKRKADTKWRTLLINGSVSHKFIHKGVNVTLKSTNEIRDAANLVNSEFNRWMTLVRDKLNQLKVDCVLVSGKADPRLTLFLYSEHIVFLSNVGAKVVENLSNHTGAKVATYIAHCDQINVATGLTLQIEAGEVDIKSTQQKDILVALSSPDINFQTVLVCHPILSYALVLEHRFWHTAHRLASVCHSGKCLPGGGATERHAWDSLHQMPPRRSLLFPACRDALAEAFRCYADAVISVGVTEEIDDERGNAPVFDDYDSKVEAWQSAFRLACLILRTDTMLVTGEVESQLLKQPAENFDPGANATLCLGHL